MFHLGHIIISVGDIFTPRYNVVESLRRGTFGTVLTCVDCEKKQTVAVKVIRAVQKYRHSARYEIQILRDITNSSSINQQFFILTLFVIFQMCFSCLNSDC